MQNVPNASQDNFKGFETCFNGVCLSDQTTNLYSPPTFYSTKLFLDFSSFFLLFYLIFSTTLSTFVFFFSLNFELLFLQPTNTSFSLIFFFFWTSFLANYPHTCLFVYPTTSQAQQKTRSHNHCLINTLEQGQASVQAQNMGYGDVGDEMKANGV